MKPDRDTIESALEAALDAHCDERTPSTLSRAVRYAVLGGGHRIRPKICLSVAHACGCDEPELALATAVSVELMHCASLVHDDLPCFDDAALRRGRPTVHAEFGEAEALLAGDALILLAMQVLFAARTAPADRVLAVSRLIGSHVGIPRGIIAGQGWEFERDIDLDAYHCAKTGALFAAASMAGAAAAGQNPREWRALGECMGRAYQIADDLLDSYGDPDVIGKPVGNDERYNRPNSADRLGLTRASSTLKRLVSEANESIPDCPGRMELSNVIARESEAFMALALRRERAA